MAAVLIGRLDGGIRLKKKTLMIYLLSGFFPLDVLHCLSACADMQETAVVVLVVGFLR